MTYCQGRVELMQKAGSALCTELLPKPFQLQYSDHSTGCQMTIVVSNPPYSTETVWKGSVWYSSTYEFNDRNDVPGLQPDFEFARTVIEKYFADLQSTVNDRNEASARRNAEQAAEAAKSKAAFLASLKEQIQAPAA